MKHIVVIGGGFAGINFCLELSRSDYFRITLVDRNNYNFFPPLLYQVATGYLEPSSISYPYRKLFQRRKNLGFHMGELIRIRPEEKVVVLSTGELHYDELVIAIGTESNFFGMDNVRKNALPLKSISDALLIRNDMLQKLEVAAANSDPGMRNKLLTIVIAGGGPTGVEVSGMLAEMKRNILKKDYPELNGADGKIFLADTSAELLAAMSAKSQRYTHETLTRLGVVIKLNDAVEDFANDTITFKSGARIEAATLIWTAGVTAKSIDGIPVACYGRAKRLIVDSMNKVSGIENVFALGDNCIQVSDPGFPGGHPQLAQVALQQGKCLAKNLLRIERGQPAISFRYKDKGTMAIIGRNKAVAEINKPTIRFTGFVAWLLWIFIHLISLINYRNRVKTLFNWLTAYFSKDQALRMMIKAGEKDK